MRRFPKYLFSDNKKRNLIYSVIFLFFTGIALFSIAQSSFYLVVNGQRTTAEVITKEEKRCAIDYSASYVFDGVVEVLEFDSSRCSRWSGGLEYYIGQEIDIVVAKHNDEVYWTISLVYQFLILCMVWGGFSGLIYYLFFKKSKEILST